MRTRRILEVCLDSVEVAIAAQAAGADRLELNCALELGGLTPSLGFFREVAQVVRLPLIVMIRPHATGFCYSPREQAVMLRDAEIFLAEGATGIAAGPLLPGGGIDMDCWRRLVALVADREIVFHRAFDEISDQEAALQELVDLRTTRILTSGGAVSAWAGAARLARLVEVADGRIEILPAAGIVPEKIAELLRITGCNQVHGSFRHAVEEARWELDALARGDRLPDRKSH